MAKNGWPKFVLLACLLTFTANADDLSDLAAKGEWSALDKTATKEGARLARNAHRNPADYARIAALRALALHHLGKTRDAVWYWQAALNLDAGVAAEEMLKYPDAVSVFAPIGVPSIAIIRDPAIRPAEPVKMARPARLTPKDAQRKPAGFDVRIIVGTDGVPHSAQLIGDIRDEGDRAYSALDAIREWRFRPATSGGTKVEFRMSIGLALGATGAIKGKGWKPM